MMAHSIEGRMPFMDVKLAMVAARLPDKLLTGSKGGKAILREAMTRVLPQRILARKKIGFSVPIGEWFRGPYRDFIRDLLFGSSSFVRRVCDEQAIKRLMTEHTIGRHDNAKSLWSLANLELFLRSYNLSGF
jgi:asparagine synthase (glutamine-hydrolysing)